MNYYLLDDDINIIQMLKRIIESTMDRDVLGFATDPIEACEEIEHLRPDVLIIDYLMPDLHGVDAILRLKEGLPNLKIIMLSQVTDKSMVADSYAAGTDFFITKPINKIEVTRVLDQIERTIEMERTLERISGLLDTEPKQKKAPGPEERGSTILRELGILGEKGAEDLLEIVSLSAEHPSADPGDLVDVYIARTGGEAQDRSAADPAEPRQRSREPGPSRVRRLLPRIRPALRPRSL
jgi:two-component system response regulator YcbB